MKNKYIFLIIAVGFAAYFLIRPQMGMSKANMQQAQVLGFMSIKCLNNPAACILSAISSNGQTISINTGSQQSGGGVSGGNSSNSQGMTVSGFATLGRDGTITYPSLPDGFGGTVTPRPIQCGRPPRRIPGYYYSCMGNGRYIRIP